MTVRVRFSKSQSELQVIITDLKIADNPAGHRNNLDQAVCQVFDYFDKYTFLCDMYEMESDKVISLVLNFFPFDNSVQVIDSSRGKQMLKRTQYPSIKIDMLQVGNIVSIFSKLLHIVDCAPITMRTLFKNSQSTFAMIKPIPPSEHGKVLTFIMKKGFRIVQMRNGKLTKNFAMKIYSNVTGSGMMPIIIDYVTSGEVIGLELVAPDAVAYFRHCLGATEPKDAAPGTLRQLYGQSILKNIAHGANTLETAAEILEDFFGADAKGNPNIPFRATLKDCTCCIIKPHAVTDGNLGAIVESITTSGKFVVTATAMFSVSLPDAREFYEIYKGVLPEYEEMAVHLAEGKCVVLEVKSIDPSINPVCEFRKLCGPRDPDKGRQLYPDTIRALYGKDRIHNAVHCTDLPEDGELEVEYFFKLLGSSCQ